MSGQKLDKVVKVLTKYELEFASDSELDSLVCAKCRRVIKDAVQVPCGCKYCRDCLETLIENDGEVCLGQSDDCKGAPLTNQSSDYWINQKVFKLIVKCPMISCTHQCKLVELDDHLLECSVGSESHSPCRALRLSEDAPMNLDALRRLRFSEEPANQIKKLSKKVKRMDDEARERSRTLSETMGSIKEQMSEMNDKLDSVTVDNESLKEHIYSIKSQLLSIQRALLVDVSFTWTIQEDFQQQHFLDRKSDIFHGVTHRYKYQLTTCNSGSQGNALLVYLNILSGVNDKELDWPFDKLVTVTVSDTTKPEVCRSSTVKCRLERPLCDKCSKSNAFRFGHEELTDIEIDLSTGLRVSCAVVIN